MRTLSYSPTAPNHFHGVKQTFSGCFSPTLRRSTERVIARLRRVQAGLRDMVMCIIIVTRRFLSLGSAQPHQNDGRCRLLKSTICKSVFLPCEPLAVDWLASVSGCLLHCRLEWIIRCSQQHRRTRVTSDLKIIMW